MSEPAILVNFRLETPLHFKWLAKDGTPHDGYKAQIVAIELADGVKLAMDASAIMEQVVADPRGGAGDYLLTFNGMVGYPAGHPDRAKVDAIAEQPVDYTLSFVHDDGRVADQGKDFTITERPRAVARKIGK